MKTILQKFYDSELPSLFRSKLFWLGTTIKLVLGSFLASSYLQELFLPFIDFASKNGINQAYSHFLSIGITDAFPYPGFMAYIFTSGYTVFSAFADPAQSASWGLLSFRTVLFFFDLVVLVILWRWLRSYRPSVLLFYWLSPIIIYITYIHGQLDMVPTGLMFVSLYLLFRNHFVASSALLGLALATKTHLVLAIPFHAIYVLNSRSGAKTALLSAFALTSAFVTCNLQFIGNPDFFEMVFANQQQKQLFGLSLDYNSGVQLYLFPVLYLSTLTFVFNLKGFTRETFLTCLAFSFGSLGLAINPMPGWYLWFFPFFIYFFVKSSNQPKVLFTLLNVAYFCYFAIVPQSDYLQIFQNLWPDFASKANLFETLKASGSNAEHIVNLAFTGLQSLLLIYVGHLFSAGTRAYQSGRLSAKPFVIGLAGNSGVGKTTIQGLLVKVFGQAQCSVIYGDDSHRWERGSKEWQEFTHLDPKANYLHREIHFLETIKQGTWAKRRHYNHSTGRFDPPKKIQPNKVVIYEGLHTLFLEKFRQAVDLKVFVDAEESLRCHWKIRRDSKKRGYTKQQVLDQISARQKDEKFIESQSRFADVAIRFFADITNEQMGGESFEPKIGVRVKIKNSVAVESLMETIKSNASSGAEVRVEDIDEEFQTLVFCGQLDPEVVQRISFRYLPQLDDYGIYNSNWLADEFGFIQLVLATSVFSQLGSVVDDYL